MAEAQRQLRAFGKPLHEVRAPKWHINQVCVTINVHTFLFILALLSGREYSHAQYPEELHVETPNAGRSNGGGHSAPQLLSRFCYYLCPYLYFHLAY